MNEVRVCRKCGCTIANLDGWCVVDTNTTADGLTYCPPNPDHQGTFTNHVPIAHVAAVAPLLDATRTAPSEYHVDTNQLKTGQYFAAHGETFKIVGDPFLAGWRAYWVRVREVGGRFDGNEFAAYLHTN